MFPHTHTHTRSKKGHDEISAKLHGRHYINFGNNCIKKYWTGIFRDHRTCVKI